MTWRHIFATFMIYLLVLVSPAVLSAAFDPGCAWNPSPARYATDVHFIGGLTLSWSPGDWVATGEPNGHYVFLGTSFDDVNTAGVGTAGTSSPVFTGRRDVNNITVAGGSFVPNRTYYWRVDEINDPCNHKGIIWEFETVTDKATNPSPADGGGLKMPLELTWTAGDWSPSVHRVFFGTSYALVVLMGTIDTTGVYRGTVDSPAYPLKKLLDTGRPEVHLTLNTTYYWRIDENSYIGGNARGTVWSLNTGDSIVIDDFQEYDFTADLNSVWLEGVPVCPGGKTGSGRVSLVREGASGRYMQFTYDKTGGTDGRYFSEVAYLFSNPVDFTGGGVLALVPNTLELTYRGFAINSADPDYDRMYVAVEDTNGNVSIALHPDADAQRTGPWTMWRIYYNVLAADNPSVDINNVAALYLGAGERCLSDYYGGGDGNVMFDDIELSRSEPWCWPEFGPVADFNDDCIVNIDDLYILAGEWLDICEWVGPPEPPVEPNKPILWYKFDETTGTAVNDSGTGDANDYTGSVINFNASLTWDTAGGRNGDGCIYLPWGSQDTYVEGTASGNPFYWLYDSSTNSITFSIWENADVTAYDEFSGWSGIFGTWNIGTTTETLEIHCPSPWGAANAFGPSCDFINRNVNGPTATTGPIAAINFGGRWNNWIFVHDRTVTPAEMRVYLNGELVADANTNDGAGCALPLMSSVGSLRIGTRGGNWGTWAGELDDFQVYDYALSEAEVLWIATDGGVTTPPPPECVANIKPSSDGTLETVNFGDLALMLDEWMTEKLYLGPVVPLQ